MIKPADVFDRAHEWTALDAFVRSDRAGATLGLVYGRRRQGKTYLLEGLAEASRGFYYAALRQSSEQNLQRLAGQYRQYVGSRVRVAFSSWDEALTAVLALGQDAAEPVPVVLDEFPYLLAEAPQIPSLLQDLLRPRGTAARTWRTRLILCGSAVSTMRGLLAGTAPLRGRAALELVVHPFGYRDAAEYWNLNSQPDLALRLHALVGGTPAYLDMCGGAGPESPADLDAWVGRTLLDPASAMFREGNVLLSEEDRIVDTSVYGGVLTAISQGRTRRGEIAATIGRPQTALGHPLAVLTEARLIEPLADALRQKRATFHVAEPVLRLNQLVIAPNEARLSRHQAVTVWASVADTVSAKIYGPHFEMIARAWCIEYASSKTLGGTPTKVAPSQVTCREHRCHHEVDLVVVATRPQEGELVLALGEAKWWSRPLGLEQLRGLEHTRELLGLHSGTRLLLFSRSGFTPELAAEAGRRDDVELVGVERLYTGD